MCPVSTFLTSEHGLGTANYENKIAKALVFDGFQVHVKSGPIADGYTEGRILVLRWKFGNFIQV